MIKKLLSLFLVSSCAIHGLFAQTVSSPYSIVGIGDLEQRNISKYAGMASVSIAQRSGGYINSFNPASLTAMPKHLVIFEVEGKGRTAKFQVPGADTSTSTSKDFSFKRLSFAYKISGSTAFSFGLKPYSSVNYSFSSIKQLGTRQDAYLRTVEGSGGLQQGYISVGIQLGKHFSVGATLSSLFGSLNQKINYYSGALGLDVTKDNNTYLRKLHYMGGIQYESSINKKAVHRFGLTLDLPATLNAEYSYQVLEGTTDVTENIITKNTTFNVPLKAAFGYSISLNKSFSFGADYIYQNWKNQVTSIDKTILTPNHRVAAGIEYTKINNVNSYVFDSYFLQAGLFYESSYWKVAGNPVADYGITFGGGYNLGRINVFGAYEVGKRGAVKLSQIAENYNQFTIGITFKDIWEKSRYARYD